MGGTRKYGGGRKVTLTIGAGNDDADGDSVLAREGVRQRITDGKKKARRRKGEKIVVPETSPLFPYIERNI